MTTFLPDSAPVEARHTDKVLYVAESRKRVRRATLQGVSECGRFVKIHKLSHQHWISVQDVKQIQKGKLKLIPDL
jgi:hypothetical protein